MFKFLRSNAKFFYWVIAATFIAFIFVAWGMDVAGGGGAAGPAIGSIGSVDGVDISAQQYEMAVQQIQAGMRRNNPDRPLTANQVALAREQAWDQVVRETILYKEIAKRNLTVTDAEVLRIFKESPPPEILAAFADETGQPDLQAYYAALGNPNAGINWVQAENYVRQSVPRQKLAQMLTAGVSVSEDEVRDAYRGQTGRAVVEFMGLNLDDMAGDYQPSDAEIQAYYDSHPGDFRQDAQALCKAVAWEITPGAEDFDEVRALALEVKAEIESGARTFEEAAAVYSEDGSASNGGDLGTFDRNRMVAPFTEAAFSLPVGQISDPVETQFGFHLIEVLEQETEGGEVARVHARHILLRVTPSEATRDAVYERATAFREAATADNFMGLADADTTAKVLSPRPFFEGRDVPGLRDSAAGGRFVFRSESGAISPLYFTEDHVYIVLSEGVQPPGSQPLDRVRAQVELSLRQERQTAAARNQLAPAVARVRAGEAMADVAAELGMIHAVSDTITNAANIPEVGYATAMNTVALQTEQGTLVPEVATGRGLFAMTVLWQQPMDEELYASRREMLRTAILQQKQARALEDWFQARIAELEIRDLRDSMM